MIEETVGVIRHSTLPADWGETLKTTYRLFNYEHTSLLSAREGGFIDDNPGL